MKTEMFMKLALSFKALGISMKYAAAATNKFQKMCVDRALLERKLAHRKKCALIIFAISQTCSQKKKRILWNMFKNQEI